MPLLNSSIANMNVSGTLSREILVTCSVLFSVLRQCLETCLAHRPCWRYGVCVDFTGGYTCQCVEGYVRTDP